MLTNQKLGYKTEEGVDFNTEYGYKTLFSNFKEYMLERISIETLKKSLGIKICCGRLSYSNLLESYDIMIGLSGNLNTVTNF